jgi:hypothetical protein
MGIIDRWAENMFRNCGEQWSPVYNTEECNKKISNFFENISSVSAYISRDSLFFQEFENEIKKEGAEKKVIYHNKQLTFIVSNDAILIEDNKQLFIKYHSKILGKRFSERFDELYKKSN